MFSLQRETIEIVRLIFRVLARNVPNVVENFSKNWRAKINWLGRDNTEPIINPTIRAIRIFFIFIEDNISGLIYAYTRLHTSTIDMYIGTFEKMKFRLNYRHCQHYYSTWCMYWYIICTWKISPFSFLHIRINGAKERACAYRICQLCG